MISVSCFLLDVIVKVVSQRIKESLHSDTSSGSSVLTVSAHVLFRGISVKDHVIYMK